MTPGSMTRRPALLALLAALVICGSCKEKTRILCKPNEGYDPSGKECYPCPAGWKVDHDDMTCVPKDVPADTIDDADSMLFDTRTDSLSDLPFPDVQAELTPDAVVPQDLQSPPDTLGPPASGGPCKMDLNCPEGESCLDWPGGYCAKLSCEGDTDCAGNASCLPFLENGSACFPECDPAGCRDGYSCKTLPEGLSGYISLCFPAAGGSGYLELCQSHGDCAAALACVSLAGERRCLALGCAAQEDCGEGQACVLLGSLPVCLPSCGTELDCAGWQGLSRCAGFLTPKNKTVKVCAPASSGAPMGAACAGDFDCEGAFCLPFVQGGCSDSGADCFDDYGCAGAVCLLSSDRLRGVCSAACSPSSYCSAGICIAGQEGLTFCAQACNAWGSCDLDGLSCIYGDPKYPPSGGGRYACAPEFPGQPGALCQKDNHCAGEDACFLAASGQGYCAPACDPFNPQCTFGSLCAKRDNKDWMCLRRCKSGSDCPSGFSCTTPIWAGVALCVPS